MKNILFKKRKGQGDLIASLFVILALSIFVLFFIYAIGDVNTRIQMDQVARKYILRMESSGNMTDAEINALKTDLMAISTVKNVAGDGGDNITVRWNNGAGAQGYGSTITLDIECPAEVVVFKNGTVEVTNADGTTTTQSNNIFGVFEKETRYFYITKQSTAKY